MSSQHGPYRNNKDLTGFCEATCQVFCFKTQTAFGLPKPQTVCKGECNVHYMRGLKWSLNET